MSDNIVALHNSILSKLNEAIEGTPDFEEGPLANPKAPCLIRQVIREQIELMAEINLESGNAE